MDEATKLKKLKESENYKAPAGGRCLVLVVLGLFALLGLMVAPVVAIRSREAAPAAVAQNVSNWRQTATAQPTNTAAPTVTSSPLPSSTPPATWTAQATFTPQSTHTPLPTNTRYPTDTPMPSATVTPEPTGTIVPAAGPVFTSPVAPSLPPAVTPPDGISTMEAAVLALALTVAIFAILLLAICLYLALQQRRATIAPAPLLIEGEVIPAPTPSPYHPAFIRPLPPQERRFRPVAPVQPVQPVPADGVTTLTSGGEGIMISVPFDKTRPPTPSEMAYIRARYVELGSVNKVAADCFNGKSPVILDYIRQALEQGGIAYPTRRPAVRQIVIAQ